MNAGARTPEELETLLEDAFLLHDPQALARLFHPGAMLVAGGGLPEARGRRQITQVAARLWDTERLYLADPRRVLQARGTALVLAGRAINVVRRTDDGSWRYAISLLDLCEANKAITGAFNDTTIGAHHGLDPSGWNVQSIGRAGPTPRAPSNGAGP
jgi:hypothetical protein